jgi:type II secretion system-associated lipoprotein
MRNLKYMILFAFSAALFVTACDVFIPRTDVDTLKAYEKKVFVMKKDLELEGKKLKKGDDVRLIVTAGKDWVKVHAYPAKLDPLKAERLLVLYIFEDDFTGKKFNMNFFKEKLGDVAAQK